MIDWYYHRKKILMNIYQQYLSFGEYDVHKKKEPRLFWNGYELLCQFEMTMFTSVLLIFLEIFISQLDMICFVKLLQGCTVLFNHTRPPGHELVELCLLRSHHPWI